MLIRKVHKNVLEGRAGLKPKIFKLCTRKIRYLKFQFSNESGIHINLEEMDLRTHDLQYTDAHARVRARVRVSVYLCVFL